MQYVVYKIKCNSPDVGHFYIGSTKNLKIRTRKHKYDSKNQTNTIKLYTTIRAYDGFDNWKLKVIESGTCETKFEIKSRERYYYDELSPDLNMIRPQASKEELRLDKLEKMKQYDKKNKEKLKIKKKENSSIKIHCDTCCCEYSKGNKGTHYKSKKHLNNLQMMSNAQ